MIHDNRRFMLSVENNFYDFQTCVLICKSERTRNLKPERSISVNYAIAEEDKKTFSLAETKVES